MRTKSTRQQPVTPLQWWAWRRALALKARVHDLSYFFWEATLRCNLTCRHCGSDCTRDAQGPELPADRVIEVFRDIAAHNDARTITVAVTGGEPLVRPDLFTVTEELGRLGFPWGMVTNGMLVTDRVVEQCARTGMRTVSVSLDGLEDTHNWLRNNPTSFRKAVNALRAFRQAGFLALVGAITCAHPGNIDQLEEIYNLLRENDVQEWRIFSIFPKGRASVNRDLVADGPLLEKVLRFVKAKRDADPDFLISYCEEGYLGCSWERLVRDYPFYCSAGIQIGGLLCDGSFSACPSLSREWIQGHIDGMSFTEAWETRYQNMRDRSWMQNDYCAGCREWKNCKASSLHIWDWQNHRPQMCHHRLLEGNE